MAIQHGTYTTRATQTVAERMVLFYPSLTLLHIPEDEDGKHTILALLGRKEYGGNRKCTQVHIGELIKHA